MNVVSTLASGESSSGSSASFMLILLLVPVAMYFFLIRPQRRRMKEQQALQRSVGIGDEVVTAAGIFGTITGEEPELDAWWIEVDDDIQIRVLKAAVTGRAPGAEPPAPAAVETGTTADEPETVETVEPAEPVEDERAKNKRP